jgi:uncharacterized protein (DUF1800 family)
MREHDYITAFRFGFGVKPAEVFDPYTELHAADGRADVTRGTMAMRERFAAWAKMGQYVNTEAKSPEARLQERAFSALLEKRDLHEAIANAVASPKMFTERLALFWSNHFSLGSGNAAAARFAAPAQAGIRHAMFGNFQDLLWSAVMNPAMMLYLNLQQAIGPNSRAGKNTDRGLNENLGREILELHALGVGGGYKQQDVGALSRLLTGWHFERLTGEVQFLERRAEPGAKSLLGKTIGGKTPVADDLFEAFATLAKHPATARFISTKLVLHFLGPGLTDISDKIAATFLETSGNLSACYDVLLQAAAKLPPTQLQYRNDLVFLISALRALSLRQGVLDFEELPDGRPKPNPATTGAMSIVRQRLWLAPSPAGWSDEPAYWRSPSVMLARLQLIPRLARLSGVLDPVVMADEVLGPLLRPATREAVTLAPNRLQGMGLVLASPEFNRR